MNLFFCFLLVFVIFYLPNSIGGKPRGGKKAKENAEGKKQHQKEKPQQIKRSAQIDEKEAVNSLLPSEDEEKKEKTFFDEDDRSFSFPHDFASSSFSQNVTQSEPKFQQISQQKYISSLKNSLGNLLKQNSNEMGTLETFYKEIVETALEIYRQRDNSGKYIKFRLVDQKSDQTIGQWIMPKPKDQITLFFNNNQSVPFHFDRMGKMIKEEKMPSSAAEGRALFEQMKIWKLNECEIDEMIANSTPTAPIYAENGIPKQYNSENVYKWHKMPLPFQSQMFNSGKESSEEEKKKGKETKFDQITERLDDGQNWVQIKVKQNESRAEYVRNLFGRPPKLPEELPLTLFFDGAKRHFDWNGTAMSNIAFNFWRKSSNGKAKQKKAEERAKDKWTNGEEEKH